MMKPKKMKKIRLIVLKSQIEDLVSLLHNAGLVDIKKTHIEGLDSSRPLVTFEEISSYLLRLRTAHSLMTNIVAVSESIELKNAKKIMEDFDIDLRLKKISKENSDLKEGLKALKIQQKSVEKLIDFEVDFSKLNTRSISYKIGETQKVADLKIKSENQLENATVLTSKGIALIIFERKNRETLETIASSLGFSEFEIPNYITTPRNTVTKINNEIESLNKKLSQSEEEIIAISKENAQIVKNLIKVFEIESEKAEIASRFSNTKYAYIIEGWVIDENFKKVENIVNKCNDAYLEDVKIDEHHDIPPTVLENRGPVGPFEFITKNYSFPKYNELDPTLTYFLFLSIIYGMIVGDFVYGLISIVVSLIILKKFPKNEMLRNVAFIWIVGSIPTMIFGVIYDEWGGLTHIQIANWIENWTGILIFDQPIYTGFHRVSELGDLLLLSLFVGIAHIGVGLTLGALSEWSHSKKHAFAKIGWLMLLSAITLMATNSLGYVSGDMTPFGLVLIFVSIIIIGITESIAGLVELPGFAGNILSYLRIGVIGVVGVILAEIVNEYLKPVPEMGILALAIIPIYIILHTVNAVIAMFEALVQSGRLNIFEYRSKFIVGGGKKFSPFALKKNEVL